MSSYGWLGVVALMVVGCGGNNVASQLVQTPDYEAAPGQAQCKVGASQDKPLIVEWPSGERSDLEARSRQGGLVVVRYEGCEMQILSRCQAPGNYAYIPVTTKQDTLVIDNADELYANMPIGAVKLESKLASAGRLNVNMTLVGKFAADRFEVVDDELKGACDRATHVVVGMNVGAFEFFAGGSAEVGGGASLAGTVGAGAKSKAKRETLSRDGDPSACGDAKMDDEGPPRGCGASLRLEVAPLVAAEEEPEVTAPPTQLVCPAGTTLTDGMCQPKVSRACPDGMKFETGRGCIPVVAPLRAAALPTAGSPVRGAADAPVVIQWFGGYQDPFSRLVNPTVMSLLDRYPGQVRIVFRQAPLSIHKMARPAAYAALEVFAQKGNDGYWAMHEALFDLLGRRALNEESIRGAALKLGLDMARFDDAIARNVHKAKVDEDFAQFNAQGFRGTPTFTVGKDIVSGAQPIEPFLMAVARVKAGRDGQQLPRPTAAARAGGGRLVAIHWFGSFQDPATSRMLPVIQQVLEAYPKQVGVYWRDLPLPTLDRARPAARVVGAARGGMQAWNLLERLLLQRTRLSDADLVAHAKPLGIDESRVRKALAGDDAFVEKRIAGDIDIAKRFGAHAVPTLFINGVKLEGGQSFAAVKRVIEEALTPLR